MTPKEEKIRSTCGFCYSGCGVWVTVTDGKVTKVAGDPESPVNRGRLCPKGLSAPEQLYHPQRLRHPLQRTGARGSGQWRKISWDQAFDHIAEAFQKTKEQCGPQGVAFVQGAAKGLIDSYHERLANAFGSPNFATSGHVCFLPRLFAAKMTCGFYPVPDYQGSPACILVWGANLAHTRHGEHFQALEQLKKGARLILIDPLPIQLADRADLWLRLKPGSDLALALGLLHVIVNENLYDQKFVARWTIGFEQLQAHVQPYSPEKVEQLTWVSAEQIRQTARTYASLKPACLQWGNAVDHGLNSFQTARALTILRAITGNLDVYGGDLDPLYPLPGAGSVKVTLRDRLPPEQWAKRIDARDHLLPIFQRVLPQNLIRAILENDPYPLRAMYVHASNPLLTFGNSKAVLRALRNLDFLLVTDRFMTPTAALADVVLPAATYLEYDNIIAPPYYPIARIQHKAVEWEECRSDYRIINGIAERLGLGRFFFENLDDFFDLVLEPSGLTFREFREQGVLTGARQAHKYINKGFATPSGKIELDSARLKEWGFDSLPVYHEPLEASADEQNFALSYPLILTTQKSRFYRHSDGRQIKSLREKHSDPFVWVHPDTAEKFAIRDDDWVYLETRQGRIKQKARLSEKIDPRVVAADFGWWFPEKSPEALFGWAEANLNVLTSAAPPFDAEMGSSQFRGIPCRIYKAEE